MSTSVLFKDRSQYDEQDPKTIEIVPHCLHFVTTTSTVRTRVFVTMAFHTGLRGGVGRYSLFLSCV